MLSLWKLRVGAEAYYLSQVASGIDDYYSGQGEASGRWVGNAVSGLGLAGTVTGEGLRAVLAGLAPGTGLTPNGDQLRASKRRVPGFDLTFSVPKSVSVVYALGDPLVQAKVVEAGEAAVADALAWLEREACFVRRGTNNRQAKVRVEQWGTRRLPGAGFVAAEFRHRTSRAGDPQLHWHVLVANVTRGPDGRWSALDGTALYRSKRAAGVVFQAALRRELTERLGVEWLPTQRDAADIAGIPQRILRLFSKRRVEIEAELDRLGRDGARAAEEATLATRHARRELDAPTLDTAWKVEAEAAGWGSEHLDRLLAGLPSPTTAEPVVADPEAFVTDVATRLVQSDSVFTRHEVTQVVAALLPHGATTATVDAHTSLVLAHPELVPMPAPAGAAPAAGWVQRYTTRSLLHTEQRLLDTIANGRHGGVGVLSDALVDSVLAVRGTVGEDQAEVARRLTTQGNAVEVLVGRAGTGKTFTLAAVADAYRAAGWKVVGVAPSARAARELEHGAGITAFTVPRFHHHTERHPLTGRSVVVVDEAGMCGTLDLAAVLDTARSSGAKVVLVGDHHQLPEVAAGGGFAAAVEVLGDEVCELTVNRRQHQPWEVTALAELRHGDVTTAWHAYVDHDRVVILDDPTDLHRRAVDDWWASHASGRDALLLAGTRAEAATLNRLARHYAAATGHLTGPALEVAGRSFLIGDRVLLTRNATDQHTLSGERTSVDNGTLAEVVAVDHAHRTVDIAVLGSGRAVRLTSGYLAAGWVDHGYAMTIHKSQGATCDEVLVVGPAGLYREAAYVALSRARHGARLYATSRQAHELDSRSHTTGLPLPSEQPDDGVEHELVTHLQRSQAKTLASRLHAHALAIEALAAQPLDVLQARLQEVLAVEHGLHTSGLADPDEAVDRHRRAVDARTHLAPGERVRALDWDNVGTVLEIRDHTGEALVRFVADDGATATRALPWSDLKPIDHPPAVPLTPEAEQWLAQLADDAARTGTAWAAELAALGVIPRERECLTAAIEVRSQRVTHNLRGQPPEWLSRWLGARPADPVGANVWDDTLGRIATWRDRHHLDPSVPGFGPPPAEPATVDAWTTELTGVLETRAWLASRAPAPPRIQLRALTPVEIQERIAELDTLIATAPPDQSRIVADLAAGAATVADLHAALTVADDTQRARRDWILTNWPHIVEREQLQELVAAVDPLAHWPTAAPRAVAAWLDRVAATIPAPAQREDRTLAELHAALASLDPGRRAQKLTTTLVQTRGRIRAIDDELAGASDAQRALLAQERDVLTGRAAALSLELDLERAHLFGSQLRGTDPAAPFRAAIQARRESLLAETLQTRPAWLTTWLSDLDSDGSLDHLPEPTVVELIARIAAYRDRWDVTDDSPLGQQPDGDAVQLDEWLQITRRVEGEWVQLTTLPTR